MIWMGSDLLVDDEGWKNESELELNFKLGSAFEVEPELAAELVCKFALELEMDAESELALDVEEEADDLLGNEGAGSP